MNILEEEKLIGEVTIESNIPSIVPFYEVKYAVLSPVKQSKKFTFEFENNQNYNIYIKTKENENYCKIQEDNFTYEKMTLKQKLQKTNVIPKYLEFDTKKYLSFLQLENYPKDKFIEIELDKETTSICLMNEEILEKYLKKEITNKEDYSQFKFEIQCYYVIQIEIKKPQRDMGLDDGILKVHYILVDNKNAYIDLMSNLIFADLFSKESLTNYINEYIYDILYKFTTFPNEEIIDTFKDLKFHVESEILQPFKEKMKKIQQLHYHSKFRNLEKEYNNLSKGGHINVPLHKNVYLNYRYDKFFNQKEFSICTKKYIEIRQNEEYSFIKNAIKEEPEDKRTYSKIDIEKMTYYFFNEFNETTTDIMDRMNDNAVQKFKEFFINYLTEKISMYIGYKGFFNIDIIINDDDDDEVNFCKCIGHRSTRKRVNKFINMIVSKIIAGLNKIYSAAEGIFHKHITINDLSFNFNQRDIIHIFNVNTDVSQKNVSRVYDILFLQEWITMIVSLIMDILQYFYGFLDHNFSRNNFEDLTLNKELSKKFAQNYKNTCEKITEMFFELYTDGLPDYLAFCKVIAITPVKGYSNIDNLCQHFANASTDSLLKSINSNVPLFNEIFIKTHVNFPRPNFNYIYEPYLILTDNKLYQFITKDKSIKNEETSLESLKEALLDFKSHLLDTFSFGAINERISNRSENLLEELNLIGINVDMERLKENTSNNFNYFFYQNLTHVLGFNLKKDNSKMMNDFCKQRQIERKMNLNDTAYSIIASSFEFKPHSPTFIPQPSKYKPDIIHNLEEINKMNKRGKILSLFIMKNLLYYINGINFIDQNYNFIKYGYYLLSLKYIISTTNRSFKSKI